MPFNSTESISFIHIKTNPAVLRSFLQKHLFQSDFFHYFMLPSHPRPHLCCSQVQTSLPGRFCFHCCHTYNARRTRLWADKTCCSRNRSSARRSWPGSGIQTGLRGRCASASAIAGWGWSCQNERLFLSTSHLHLKGGGGEGSTSSRTCEFQSKGKRNTNFSVWFFWVSSNVWAWEEKTKTPQHQWNAASYITLLAFALCSESLKPDQEFWHKLQKIPYIADYM